MNDLNLFSSKNDLKKLFFKSDRLLFDEQSKSDDSWQDLPDMTMTSFVQNSIEHRRNSSFNETLTEEQKPRLSKGRYDRRGHWLLFPPNVEQKLDPNFLSSTLKNLRNQVDCPVSLKIENFINRFVTKTFLHRKIRTYSRDAHRRLHLWWEGACREHVPKNRSQIVWFVDD